MEEIPFKSVSFITDYQIISLILVSFLLLVIFIFLKKNKLFRNSVFSQKKQEFSVLEQKVSSSISLYKISNKNFYYVVFVQPSGATLLDKIYLTADENSDENI
jgi:hypothetical protein